jgi:hypothetical protein
MRPENTEDPMKTVTIRIDASEYDAYDDSLAAAAAAYAAAHPEAQGWDLSPRWEDQQRDGILLDVPAGRYIVAPIADAECTGLTTTHSVLYTCDDYSAAVAAATREAKGYPYGCGILDRDTGHIDYGETCE